MGNHSGGTGKPLKLETQILVGALQRGNNNQQWSCIHTEINDCRPFRVQNMAYKLLL